MVFRFIFQYLQNGEKHEGSSEMVKGKMRSKWQMTCPLPETPVSLDAPLSQSGATMYGFMVIYCLQHLYSENYTKEQFRY